MTQMLEFANGKFMTNIPIMLSDVKKYLWLGMVAHACNPSTLGG